MVRGRTYKADVAAYNEFTQEEKDRMWDVIKEKYPIDEIYYKHKRGPVKNPLVQEQIDYILDNRHKKSMSQIGRELNISLDRVSNVCHRESYIDMIINYEKRHS